MLLVIYWGAAVGGIIGALVGSFTNQELAVTGGFFCTTAFVISEVAIVLIITNRLSLYTAPLRIRIGWLWLIFVGVILGALEGSIGGALIKASSERSAWMWIMGESGAVFGMLLVTVAIAIYMRSK